MKYEARGDFACKGVKYDNSYLGNQVKEFGKRIEEKEVRSTELVCIKLPRSMGLIAAIFACLRKKLAFCLIDAELPEIRYKEALDNAAMVIEKNAEGKTVFERKGVCETATDFSDIAYLIYTSGSTGVPKWVQVTGTGFDAFVKELPHTVPLKKGKTIVSIK